MYYTNQKTKRGGFDPYN